MEVIKINFFVKNFKLLLLYEIIAVIPVVVIFVEWYNNLLINESPFEAFLVLLVLFWTEVTSALGGIFLFILISVRFNRRKIQKIMRAADLNQVLHTKTLKQLDQILWVLSLQRTRIIRRKIKQESTEETRERLIGLILKVLKSDEMKNNAPHHWITLVYFATFVDPLTSMGYHQVTKNLRAKKWPHSK